MIDFGTLHLPDAEPAALQASEWTDWPLHGWMLVVSALILLLILPEIYKLLPAMAGCLTRSRGNLEVEHSISVARSRGNIARILALIFVVVADRYRIYDPSFIADWDEPWLRFAELAGVLAAFAVIGLELRMLDLDHAHTGILVGVIGEIVLSHGAALSCI